jgi:hypothetical protein
MFTSMLIRGLEDLKGAEILREFSFTDGLGAMIEARPDLVVLQTDCRDEGRGLPLIEMAEELGIPCVAIVCHCFQPRLQNTSKRVLFQWLGHDLIGKLESAAQKLLGC